MNQNIINDLKNFDWQTVLDWANSLEDFNDAQWRFLKGLIIEKSVAKHADPTFKYVGQVHKDYVWGKHNIDVELKSNMTTSMYTKKGKLRKNYTIKLSNSMGTNKKATLSPNDVADIIVVPTENGVFAIDRATAVAYHRTTGDGVEVKVPGTVVTPITDVIVQKTVYQNTLKKDIEDLIDRRNP